MANSVWIEPARSDWGWGFLFSLFGRPREQAQKMTAAVWAEVGSRKRSAPEAAPPIFDFKNNTLVYLYLLPSLGDFYVQPGGLVPRARGRIYVAFGEHPAAGGLYMFFKSLWHFARPCGVSLALWVAFWLHCGTLGFHFDAHGV